MTYEAALMPARSRGAPDAGLGVTAAGGAGSFVKVSGAEVPRVSAVPLVAWTTGIARRSGGTADAARSVSELVRLQSDGTGRPVLRTEDAGYLMGSPLWLPGN